jgi:hypothetical protein
MGGARSGGATVGGNSGGSNVLTGSGGLAVGGSSTGGVAIGGATSAGGAANGGVVSASGAGSGTAGKAAGGGSTSGGETGGAAGAFSAGAGGEAGASEICENYSACGCGCCGTGSVELTRCYYPEAGESLRAIIQADHATAANPNCASVGCSLGVRYACCSRGGPEPAGSATYTASYVATALDRITIVKTGSDGRCGRLGFVLPGFTSGVHTALSLPALNATSSWGFENAYELSCSMSALPPPAIGAIGSLRLRPVAGGCVADVHIKTFFSRSGSLDAQDFDADGIALEGATPNLCP